MSVPIYESQRDRANERRVAERIAADCRLKAEKLPELYPLDFALLKSPDRVHTFLEVKCRTYRSGYFADYIISLEKFTKMLELLRRQSAANVMLAVQWSDGVLNWLLLPVRYTERHAGRPDRPNDPKAKEPCACIPMSEFRVWGRG